MNIGIKEKKYIILYWLTEKRKNEIIDFCYDYLLKMDSFKNGIVLDIECKIIKRLPPNDDYYSCNDPLELYLTGFKSQIKKFEAELKKRFIKRHKVVELNSII